MNPPGQGARAAGFWPDPAKGSQNLTQVAASLAINAGLALFFIWLLLRGPFEGGFALLRLMFYPAAALGALAFIYMSVLLIRQLRYLLAKRRR